MIEVHAFFGKSKRRKWLLEGLEIALDDLRQAGCQRIFLDGSFTTSIKDPDDYDGCWDPVPVRPPDLDRMYREMPQRKFEQKVHHRGELWQGNPDIPGFDAMIKFFQSDTKKGILRKGLLEIDISGNRKSQ